MIRNPLIVKLLNNKNLVIHASKDEFQRVEVYYHREGRFGVRMLIGVEVANLAKDVEPCSRRESIDIYTYLLDELDKDNNVIDLRPVLQGILDKRKEGN
jgi:hypothetical protein|nr:MAG TPA: hypothetical protein [Caudoviricetes sp.]